MQNLVVLMEPSEYAHVSLKAGNMIFNRFCIDEDAAFELSGVNHVKYGTVRTGMENSFLRSYIISRNLISMNN